MYQHHTIKNSVCGLVASLFCLAPLTSVAASAANAAPDAPNGGGAPAGGGGGDPGGANTMTYDYTGAVSGSISADATEKSSDGETVSTSTADENAALVQNGGTLTITNGTLNKSGDDTNGDHCNFYGINSILLAVNQDSIAYISDSILTADSEGSNAIFATDSATVYANHDTITTTANNSRGLDATYDGTILANEMDISTEGEHCAAVATDRGGGSISVTNSTFSTTGSGSPLLYSTGNIQVSNVTGTASGSQIAGMEGLNTILIYNSTLESTITDATASDPMADGIIIYQSTSGDAESTTGEAASFQCCNSTLKSAITSGAMFYFTNTTANVVLSGTTLDFDSENVNLIAAQGNDDNNWGTSGSNGATVSFTGLGETLNGNIDVDTISTLDLYLLDGTVYTGAASISDNAVNTSASDAPLTVNLDETSSWIVTGDSTITNLNAADGASIVDADGKTVTIVANGSTVVSGDSDITITVTGSYSNTVTTTSDHELSTDYIDRTNFDEYYAVSTAFSTDTVSAETTADSGSAETVNTNDSNTADESSGSVAPYAIAAVIVIAGGAAVVYLRKKKTGSDSNHSEPS